MMWIVIGVASLFLLKAGAAKSLVPSKIQSLAELLVEFIRGIIQDSMGASGMRYFPLISSLFLFILFCNLLGLIPGSYTVTSQIVVTGVFALGVYALSLVIGFQLHGAKFLGILVPPGTPGWLLPLMIPIELISQLARPISLAVRLFANMTAGHVILGVLFGLTIAGGLLIGWLALFVHHRLVWPRIGDRVYPGLYFYRLNVCVYWRCHSSALITFEP